MSQPAIEADEFTFQYPTADRPALDELSFTVEAGEVLGVIGPVEAGKTSLATSLAGFVPEITGGWTDGALSVAGRDPRESDDGRVAMVFEDYSSQLTQLRLIDEVIAPLTNSGATRAEARDRARELLELVRLDDEDEEKFTWELSGGQQQRLAIAAALAIDPEVLIFDTATDMLDPEGQADVAALIDRLAGETTLVVTDNDPDALVGLADRVLALDGGRQAAFGPADDLLRDAALFDRLGIDPPTALEVARRVDCPGAPITVGEFADAYRRRLNRDPLSVEAAGADGGTGPRTFGDAVVEVAGAGFSYPDGTVAVEDVDLTVREGEVHAVIGGNGAGKSTLANMLVGIMKPDAGRVRIAGRDSRELSVEELSETAGIALQNPDEQISQQTVEAEIGYALRRRQVEKHGPFGLFGTTERYDDGYVEDRIARACELVGIDDRLLETDPVFLPRGERRLVTIASAVAPDPAAMVLDEPAAGVDSAGKATIRAAIGELAAAGKAVVLIEHDMGFVCEVADRVTVLDDGRVAMQGPVEEVFARDNWEWLSERYMRPPKVARLGRRVGVDALTRDGLVRELRARAEAVN
ncbi:MAG: ABC transporter ATP-binding protein [Halobaculum sp.]